MLSGSNISYAVGDTRILRDTSVSFNAGELSVIIGPNGSGKSTLLRILTGELKPDTGTVYYDQRQVSSYSPIELARIRAVLTQRVELPFPLLVEELVMMGRYPYFGAQPEKHDYDLCQQALEAVGLWHLRERNCLTLSGCELQLIHFARLLAQQEPDNSHVDAESMTRYLLLDEPTTYLDLAHQHTLLSFAKQAADEGAIVVCVLHDLNLAARYGKHVTAMYEGEVIATGEVSSVITPKIIKHMYHVSSEVLELPGKSYPLVVV